MFYIYIVHIIDYINILYMTYILVLYIIIINVLYICIILCTDISLITMALYKPDKP